METEHSLLSFFVDVSTNPSMLEIDTNRVAIATSIVSDVICSATPQQIQENIAPVQIYDILPDMES